MRRIFIAIVALACAAELRAGVVYRFESVSDGLTKQTFAGNVKADQGNVRIDVITGDGMFFGNGSVVLSSNGGRSITVLDPAKKTFYELDLQNLLGSATGALSQFRDLVKIDAKNPRVTARDAGAAGLIESYPVRRSHVVSSFDLVMNMFGEKTPAHFDIDTDVWATDKLPAAFANIMQSSTLRTGIDAIDRLIDLQTSTLHGFPLKQVTTTRLATRGGTTTSTTTSTVTSIRQTVVAPAEFVLPKGYTHVANPVDALLNRLGR